MTLPHDWLARLGTGERIAALCASSGITREQFDEWWRAECGRRVPAMNGPISARGLHGTVRIDRDRRGVPHIRAANDADLFFGFGYATAQDRLFQLDYGRRKAAGRLAEILGPEAVESDRLCRTLGLPQIAEREWETLPAETRDLVAAFAAGVNALIDQTRDRPPIEFDLLGYRPEPWSPVDCLLIVGEFRWYLTGRFPVIAIPELVKRAVGDGPLYRDFLIGEADDESILRPGEYRAAAPSAAVGGAAGGDGPGSNNWALAGARTTTGRPIVASDPHVLFAAVSIWHEVSLSGGSFQVAGVALAGVPAVMIGRTPRVAWGITNNICSVRDLYQERTDPAHPGCFLFDGHWEPAREWEEVIPVRGGTPVQVVVQSSRNGPIVNDVLPPAVRAIGPVSLRWQGFEPCGWLTALLGMNRARSANEFREATRPWGVPTFNLVYADADGHIGLQTTGRIPVRAVPERGYRPGWDPRHQWQGTIPFDELPHFADPPRGFVATANNRVAPDDFPQPLAGCWSSGHRARRVRQLLDSRSRVSLADCREFQHDTHSGRAAEAVPPLLRLVADDPDERFQQAVRLLREWDYRMDADAAAASVFHLFFLHWCRAVAAERLPADQVELIAGLAGGLAARLLHADANGWFHKQDRVAAIRTAVRAAVDDLTTRLGPDPAGWAWGRLHTLTQKHFLSGRGDLGELLDKSGAPVPGDATTVCNGTPDANHAAYLGAGYRMVADLSDPDGGLWAVEVAGTSGHPGSPHYHDQIGPWLAGEYFNLSAAGGPAWCESSLTLEPGTGGAQ